LLTSTMFSKLIVASCLIAFAAAAGHTGAPGSGSSGSSGSGTGAPAPGDGADAAQASSSGSGLGPKYTLANQFGQATLDQFGPFKCPDVSDRGAFRAKFEKCLADFSNGSGEDPLSFLNMLRAADGGRRARRAGHVAGCINDFAVIACNPGINSDDDSGDDSGMGRLARDGHFSVPVCVAVNALKCQLPSDDGPDCDTRCGSACTSEADAAKAECADCVRCHEGLPPLPAAMGGAAMGMGSGSGSGSSGSAPAAGVTKQTMTLTIPGDFASLSAADKTATALSVETSIIATTEVVAADIERVDLSSGSIVATVVFAGAVDAAKAEAATAKVNQAITSGSFKVTVKGVEVTVAEQASSNSITEAAVTPAGGGAGGAAGAAGAGGAGGAGGAPDASAASAAAATAAVVAASVLAAAL